MNNQKLDPFLSIAFSLEDTAGPGNPLRLFPGYDAAAKTYEIILYYTEDPTFLKQILPTGKIQLLQGSFCLALATRAEIQRLLSYPNVVYIESSRPFTYEMNTRSGSYGLSPFTGSCLGPLIAAPNPLTGRGVIVAIIDTGIDLAHPALRNPDGTTRFLSYWDQLSPDASAELPFGQAYSKEEINSFLSGENRYPLPASDYSGHGTAVAGIIAAIAPDAPLVGVRLRSAFSPVPALAPQSDLTSSNDILSAAEYILRFLHRPEIIEAFSGIPPLVINLSLGSSDGDHLGNTLLEVYLQSLEPDGRFVFVTGTGNEGTAGRHSLWSSQRPEQSLPFQVGAFQSAFSITLWKDYADEFLFEMIAPSGDILPLSSDTQILHTARLNTTLIRYYLAEPSPYQTDQLIWISLDSENGFVLPGIWELRITPVSLRNGILRGWLPSGEILSGETRFLLPALNGTFTIPSTSPKLLSVGAYDYRSQSIAPFSGRGFWPYAGKPDLIAPGVDILAPLAANAFLPRNHPGEYASFTGTSFSAPIVAGTCALLMEWGLERGNDPFLYGEKIKAVLRRSAKPLSVNEQEPNASSGYGRLCAPTLSP